MLRDSHPPDSRKALYCKGLRWLGDSPSLLATVEIGPDFTTRNPAKNHRHSGAAQQKFERSEQSKKRFQKISEKNPRETP